MRKKNENEALYHYHFHKYKYNLEGVYNIIYYLKERKKMEKKLPLRITSIDVNIE